MKLLGIDFETQCSDAKTTRITEVGASLIEGPFAGPQKHGAFAKLAGLSALCYEPEYLPQAPKIVKLTKITDDMLKAEGKPRGEVLAKLFPLMEQADYIFAHKVSFDRTVLASTCKLLGLAMPDKKWICTLSDFNWPEEFTCRKLSHLAYEHGILVDPRTLHRAENDVDLMFRLITECYDIHEVIKYATSPWVYLRADILGPWIGKGGDGGVQSGIAKGMGFSWEGIKGMDEPRFPKWWVMRCKEEKLAAILEEARTCASPFRVGRIEGIC